PEIRIELEERTSLWTIEGLLARQADLGIVVRGFETEGLEAFPYGSDNLCLAVPRGHRLARRKTIRLSEIAREELVSLDGSSAVHRHVMARAREAGKLLRIRVQVRSFEVMCQIIAQGLGVGILPGQAAKPLAGALGLSLLRIDEPWAAREFCICVHAANALPLPARRLLDALMGSTGEACRQRRAEVGSAKRR
ncbi:MAG: LysR substrate-binding domain-containing protein, partial [Hyphomicrobiaceae bacterium]